MLQVTIKGKREAAQRPSFAEDPSMRMEVAIKLDDTHRDPGEADEKP